MNTSTRRDALRWRACPIVAWRIIGGEAKPVFDGEFLADMPLELG
jgi:hypothetical protein